MRPGAAGPPGRGQLVSHANASHSGEGHGEACVCPGRGQGQARCRPRSPDSEPRAQPCPVFLKGRGAPGVALWRPRAEGVTPCGLRVEKILVVAERKTCIPVSDDLSPWGTLCLSFQWDLSDSQGVCGAFWWSLSLERQAGPEVAVEGTQGSPKPSPTVGLALGAPTPGLSLTSTALGLRAHGDTFGGRAPLELQEQQKHV